MTWISPKELFNVILVLDTDRALAVSQLVLRVEVLAPAEWPPAPSEAGAGRPEGPPVVGGEVSRPPRVYGGLDGEQPPA